MHEVERAIVIKVAATFGRYQRPHHLVDVLGIRERWALQVPQLAGEPNDRWIADLDMQVRGLILAEKNQQLSHFFFRRERSTHGSDLGGDKVTSSAPRAAK